MKVLGYNPNSHYNNNGHIAVFKRLSFWRGVHVDPLMHQRAQTGVKSSLGTLVLTDTAQ